MLIRRGVDATTNTTQNIDFGSVEASAPETHTVTVLGTLGELGADVTFHSNGKTVARLGTIWGDTIQPAGIPTSRQLGDDFHLPFVTDFISQGRRSVLRYFKEPSDITVSLPDAFPSPN